MNNNEIKQLEEEILKHKDLYYNTKKDSKISDEEYDALESKLKKHKPNSHVFQVVGSENSASNKVKHTVQMKSLDKKYDIAELLDWAGSNELLSTQKIDGISCSLIYKNGNLSLGKTRGNGVFGENITKQVHFLDSVKKEITDKSDVEIRGELFCKKDKFIELSQKMVSLGLNEPQSERNIVAGLVGRKEHTDLCSYLDFFSYDVVGKDFKLESDKFKYLKEQGFNSPQYKVIKTKKEIEEEIIKVKTFMKNGNWLIDGGVFAFNSVDKQQEAGETTHHPKYKMAFKFKGEIKTTKLIDIEWQISKAGFYTPVAILEPIELSGALISKLTLHNHNYVLANNIKINDIISLTRSGEVIPKFLSVKEHKGTSNNAPEHCYYCDSELVNDGVRLICPNKDCSAIEEMYIINFAKKIGIEDVSSKRISQIIHQCKITTVSDLYSISKQDLLNMDGFCDKLATKVIKNINKTKDTTIFKLFDSLNFQGGAKKKTQLVIEQGFNSLDSIFNINQSDLVGIKGFASKSASDFVESLAENKAIISNLIELGFKIKIPESTLHSKILEGLNICVTGKTSIPRKQIEKLIQENGGSPSKNVTSKVHILVCNEKSTSSKYKKATDLNIPILSEDQFNKTYNL